MPISLNKIPGVMLENKEYPDEIKILTPASFGYLGGFNEALTLQGQVQIRSNRDRLAELLSKHIYGKKELQYPLADAIEQHLGDILEVCPAGKEREEK